MQKVAIQWQMLPHQIIKRRWKWGGGGGSTKNPNKKPQQLRLETQRYTTSVYVLFSEDANRAETQWAMIFTLFTTESICTVMQIHGGGLQGCCWREMFTGMLGVIHWGSAADHAGMQLGIWTTGKAQITLLRPCWQTGGGGVLNWTCGGPQPPLPFPVQLHEDFSSRCPLSFLWKASDFRVATYRVKYYPVWGAVRCCL